jgi:hypothetical protein
MTNLTTIADSAVRARIRESRLNGDSVQGEIIWSEVRDAYQLPTSKQLITDQTLACDNFK